MQVYKGVNTKPLLRYRLLLGILSPWLFFKVVVEAFKLRDLRFFQQRMGFSCRHQCQSEVSGRPVWIHCASVGEVAAVRPLVERIQKQLADTPLLMTTTTVTGAETVLGQGWENLQHQYLPVDFHRAVKYFFDVNRPRVLLIMETEIWPNLILYARKQKIPVLIINGRISERTLNTPAWLKPVYRQVLPQLDGILCKSDANVQRFTELGADSKVVRMVGNIKFAIPAHRSVSCDIKRPFWLAASTHEDEERKLCEALQDSPLLKQSLLVIAPRHPQRSIAIQKAVADCGLRFAVRSKSQLPDDDTQVYIADTLGEMNSWLSDAQLVFMGGSLIPLGGHNLLQPASAGVPIISGQYLDNVSEEARLLMKADAMIQVYSAKELVECVESLLTDISRLHRMGRAGKEVVTLKAGIIDDYMNYILPYVDTQSN